MKPNNLWQVIKMYEMSDNYDLLDFKFDIFEYLTLRVKDKATNNLFKIKYSYCKSYDAYIITDTKLL